MVAVPVVLPAASVKATGLANAAGAAVDVSAVGGGVRDVSERAAARSRARASSIAESGVVVVGVATASSATGALVAAVVFFGVVFFGAGFARAAWVFAPTIPSTRSRASCWNARTARSVTGPNTPSTRTACPWTPRRTCIACTLGPVSPSTSPSGWTGVGVLVGVVVRALEVAAPDDAARFELVP